MIGFLGRVPLRIGYATGGRSFLLSHPLALPAWRASRHESFYYLNIIAELEQLLHGQSKILEQEPFNLFLDFYLKRRSLGGY